MRPRLAGPCVIVMLLIPADASAHVSLGYVWPGPKVTYWLDAPRFRHQVARAQRTWNRARVGIVIARARSRADADVLISDWNGTCGGRAWAGYYGPGVRTEVHIGHGCRDRRLTALVATHEFGHVLGLGHELHACALMNRSFDRTGTPRMCRQRSLAFWYRRPLRHDDIAGVRSRYEGDATRGVRPRSRATGPSTAAIARCTAHGGRVTRRSAGGSAAPRTSSRTRRSDRREPSS
jgi:hypothetical protein